MAVKQFSAFISNTPGSLAKFAKLLSDNAIDLVSLTMADTTNFGIVRGIADDNEKAAQILSQNGFGVKMTDVLAVSIPDQPGGFTHILTLLSEGGINIEYLYSTIRSAPEKASIIIRVEDTSEAEKLLLKAGVRLLSHEELCGK